MNNELHLTDYKNQPTYGTTRDGFGQGLVEAAAENPELVGLCADLTDSTRMREFQKNYPERFVEMGVAEENMIGVAAGLALGGKIPVAASYAVFSPGNSLGPLRSSVCYSNLPVKIMGGHTGLSAGRDGATHQALEDLAIMRTLPNMTVIAPCDQEEARKAIKALVKHPGPGYLRTGKHSSLNITSESTPFEIGKALMLREGTDVTIIACGTMVSQALDAADMLEYKKISAAVINLHTIKPIDVEAIVLAAEKTGAIVTAEDHQQMGGMGSAVAEVVAAKHPVPMEFVGMDDSFGESGSSLNLMAKYRLTAPAIVNKAIQAIERKKY